MDEKSDRTVSEDVSPPTKHAPQMAYHAEQEDDEDDDYGDVDDNDEMDEDDEEDEDDFSSD